MTVATMTNGGLQQYAECGTEAAYRRHLRENRRRRENGMPEEPIDEACRAAHAAIQARQAEKTRLEVATAQGWRHPRLPDDAGHVDLTWRPQAACRGTDPGAFDHVGREPSTWHRAAAGTYCAGCPVIQLCADEADRLGDYGVRAGSYRNGGAHITKLIKNAPPRRFPRPRGGSS